ncbi:MAG: HalOD1 output domain-containing protein [Halanaeroarchaeum sp.]
MNEDIDEPPQADRMEYALQYEWDKETKPSIAVVEAVAAVTGRDPTSLPRLYDAIDPDALDALLDGDVAPSLQVRFEYAGVRVVVERDRVIRVTTP